MLNGVCGYENHIEYMERSLAVVDRMEKLVKELLYVSKAEGTQKSEYKTINFAEIFRVQIYWKKRNSALKQIFLPVFIVKWNKHRWNGRFKIYW